MSDEITTRTTRAAPQTTEMGKPLYHGLGFVDASETQYSIVAP